MCIATGMFPDKQLCNVRLDEVVEKRRLAQALNAKEFAVLAGISYSTARSWFRSPGFPSFRGHVFWTDFEKWRSTETGIAQSGENSSVTGRQALDKAPVFPGYSKLPPRAVRLLAEA
ncbi:MAG: hypothetical protein KF791_03325 [Verrucomicrobiae bacterium]|nr:hypothetical protein [Verrucomicrobiae bacterium]